MKTAKMIMWRHEQVEERSSLGYFSSSISNQLKSNQICDGFTASDLTCGRLMRQARETGSRWLRSYDCSSIPPAGFAECSSSKVTVTRETFWS